jgi:hypothetical protein
MNEHGWLRLAMENVQDTKAALTLQIGDLRGNERGGSSSIQEGFNSPDIHSSDKKSQLLSMQDIGLKP